MDNPATRGATSAAISGVFAGVAAITVFLRVYTRVSIVRNPGVDDIIISISLVSEPQLVMLECSAQVLHVDYRRI